MITGFGTTLVLAATLYGINNGWVNQLETSVAAKNGMLTEGVFTEVTMNFGIQIQEWKNVLIRGSDDQQRNKYWGRFLKRHDYVQSKVGELSDKQNNVEIERRLHEFKAEHNRILPLYKKGYEEFVNSGYDHQVGDKSVRGVDRKAGKMLLEISRLLNLQIEKRIKDSDEGSTDDLQLAILLLIGAVIVAFIIFLVMIKKIIVRPAQTVANDLSLMAEGDFTKPITSVADDEIGQVAKSAATLQQDIGNIVNQINKAVFKLSTSAEEMAHITEQSNQSMTQQRMETDQVATAMNEMTATVHEVAQNAQLAADSASQANNEVNTGQSVVNDSISSISKLVQQVETAADVIHALENDSVEIGSVLDVIRGIAEQTNLLALNAAIEAARAGEQGRGFAVVADEVRTLASRTQQSTEEIQSMIEKLQAGAQQAVEAMNQSRSQADVTRDTAAKAGQVLTSITASVTNINDMNTLIASSAEEQNAVAEEINRSIVNISQSAEVASEGAAHTAATSEDLRNVAEELKHVISRLKV